MVSRRKRPLAAGLSLCPKQQTALPNRDQSESLVPGIGNGNELSGSPIQQRLSLLGIIHPQRRHGGVGQTRSRQGGITGFVRASQISVKGRGILFSGHIIMTIMVPGYGKQRMIIMFPGLGHAEFQEPPGFSQIAG